MPTPTVNKNLLRKIFRPRRKYSHKGDHGKVLVIGGSKKYTGAPALVALAAIRTGVDLVTIAAPERAADIIASFSPDLITEPLKGDYLKRKHLKTVLNLADESSAVVIGNGLGRHKNTLNFVVDFLKKITIPCVIDADAIYAVPYCRKHLRKEFVITPHSYEFSIIGRKTPDNELNERIPITRKTSIRLKCTIVLKGHEDIISNGKQISINKTGNPYMTKGATGDSLAGICGALLAMRISPFNSACAAALINGKAGEMASLKYGSGFLVREMVDLIPSVLK